MGRNVWQPAGSLVCAVLVWRYGVPLWGTELMGGRITGPILSMSDIGILLFVVALPIAFASRRISGAVTVLASLLCLPLYFYFTAPGPFRWLFRGEYKIPLQASVVWEKWSVIGILALVVTAVLGCRGLLGPTKEKIRNS
jgi:hypothetical protein